MSKSLTFYFPMVKQMFNQTLIFHHPITPWGFRNLFVPLDEDLVEKNGDWRMSAGELTCTDADGDCLDCWMILSYEGFSSAKCHSFSSGGKSEMTKIKLS